MKLKEALKEELRLRNWNHIVDEQYLAAIKCVIWEANQLVKDHDELLGKINNFVTDVRN